jgi:hypothetical protein
VYAQCIEDTLSQQLPRGTYVEFDSESYLEESSVSGDIQPEDMPEENTQERLA